MSMALTRRVILTRGAIAVLEERRADLWPADRKPRILDADRVEVTVDSEMWDRCLESARKINSSVSDAIVRAYIHGPPREDAT